MTEKKKKFHQKTWFTVLMLFLFFPVGLYLMWRNKKFNKVARIVITAIIIVIAIGAYSDDDSEEKAEEPTEKIEVEEVSAEDNEASKEEAKKKKKEEEEAKAKEKAEQKKKKEAEEKKAKKEEEKANRSIEEVVQQDYDEVDKAELVDTELTITHNPETLWDENSFMRVAHDMLKGVKAGFEDDAVQSVLVLIKADMTDAKGNETVKDVVTYRYSRDVFNQLNYDNFIDMSLIEEWRVLNEADAYFIHPGIRKNLKSKYTDNLR